MYGLLVEIVEYSSTETPAQYLWEVRLQIPQVTGSSTPVATSEEQIVQGGLERLSILYFNARSLYPKLDELRVLCTLQTPDIICIAETWLCGYIENSECHLPGYNCIRCDRDRHGGGVALFISDK